MLVDAPYLCDFVWNLDMRSIRHKPLFAIGPIASHLSTEGKVYRICSARLRCPRHLRSDKGLGCIIVIFVMISREQKGTPIFNKVDGTSTSVPPAKAEVEITAVSSDDKA